jgi:predicted lipoprotein with Yx(FWY)xxD motif
MIQDNNIRYSYNRDFFLIAYSTPTVGDVEQNEKASILLSDNNITTTTYDSSTQSTPTVNVDDVEQNEKASILLSDNNITTTTYDSSTQSTSKCTSFLCKLVPANGSI